MGKLVNFLRQLATTTQLKNMTDLETVLSASTLAEIDIPDEAENHINANLLTRDRAMNDPDVVKRARTEAKGFFMDLVDDKLKMFLPKLPDDVQAAIKNEKDTLKKIELIKGVLDKADPTAAGKVTEAARKTEEELRRQLVDWEKKAKDMETAHAAQINDIKLVTIVKSKIFSRNIDKPFAHIKDTIADGIINNIRSKFKLGLENNSSVGLFQEVDGALKDVYENNNTKLTLDVVLDRELEPFIVKNNNGGQGGDTGGQQSGNNGGGTGSEQRKQSFNNNMTLEEMSRLANK